MGQIIAAITATLPHTTAIIGGGGKTTLLLALAEQAAQQGRSVLVTTTTHLGGTAPRWMKLLSPEEAQGYSPASGEVVLCGETGNDGKLSAFHSGNFPDFPQFDTVLIEADGSRNLPVKVHREDEPVIPPQTGLTILITGLSALGKPVSQVVHRFELAGLTGSEPLTPPLLTELLERASLRTKGKLLVMLNQADSEDLIRTGLKIQFRLKEKQRESVLISLRKEGAPCWY